MEHLFSFIVVNIYTYVLTDSFELHTTYLWAGIFTQVESEIQRGQIIHPRSHSLAVSNRHSLNQWMNDSLACTLLSLPPGCPSSHIVVSTILELSGSDPGRGLSQSFR